MSEAGELVAVVTGVGEGSLGEATASALAVRTDQAVGNVSHHLKILAAARLIAEAPELARDRRERWWRLTAPSTRWSSAELVDDPAAVDAAQAAERLHLTRQHERAQAWLDSGRPDDPWADAAFAMQRWFRLSPDELRELNAELLAVLEIGRASCRERVSDTV